MQLRLRYRERRSFCIGFHALSVLADPSPKSNMVSNNTGTHVAATRRTASHRAGPIVGAVLRHPCRPTHSGSCRVHESLHDPPCVGPHGYPNTPAPTIGPNPMRRRATRNNVDRVSLSSSVLVDCRPYPNKTLTTR